MIELWKRHGLLPPCIRELENVDEDKRPLQAVLDVVTMLRENFEWLSEDGKYYTSDLEWLAIILAEGCGESIMTSGRVGDAIAAELKNLLCVGFFGRYAGDADRALVFCRELHKLLLEQESYRRARKCA